MRDRAPKRRTDRIVALTFFLYALLYLGAWLVTLGVFAIVAWYARYAMVVMAALFPALGVFWFLWTWLVAVPIALLCDGSPAEKKVVLISHWFNDRTADLLMFCLTLPYHAFLWIGQIAGWLVGSS